MIIGLQDTAASRYSITVTKRIALFSGVWQFIWLYMSWIWLSCRMSMFTHPWRAWGWFTNVSRALYCDNILSKFVYYRNRTSYVKSKLKLCACAQSHALGASTNIQLEILTINMISGIVYFRDIILESPFSLVKQPQLRIYTRPTLLASLYQ